MNPTLLDETFAEVVINAPNIRFPRCARFLIDLRIVRIWCSTHFNRPNDFSKKHTVFVFFCDVTFIEKVLKYCNWRKRCNIFFFIQNKTFAFYLLSKRYKMINQFKIKQ